VFGNAQELATQLEKLVERDGKTLKNLANGVDESGWDENWPTVMKPLLETRR
jgi:hypothetical protein